MFKVEKLPGELALPCIVCGKELRNVFPDLGGNQPSGGVHARTPGNYGSTVFDSFDGEELELNICDECLTDAGRRGRVQIGRSHRPVHVFGVGVCGWEDVEWKPVTWNPEVDSYHEHSDVRSLSVDDLGDEVLDGIHLRFSVEQLRDIANDEAWKE